MFYLPKQQTCEVESCLTAKNLAEGSVLSVAAFLIHRDEQRLKKDRWAIIRYEHMKMRLFHLKRPMFGSMGFIG